MTWVKTEGGDFLNPDSGALVSVSHSPHVRNGFRIERVDGNRMMKTTIRSGYMTTEDAQDALDQLMFDSLNAVQVQGPSTDEEMYPTPEDTRAGLSPTDREPILTDPDRDDEDDEK